MSTKRPWNQGNLCAQGGGSGVSVAYDSRTTKAVPLEFAPPNGTWTSTPDEGTCQP